ncbi:MAG: hypothetical protein L3J28_09870, partial [Candidatus Polarisedimenticolaceae bacterium]|nr:hypothetical protein [Candidatus Polarisedimenticolaceae bacterium]
RDVLHLMAETLIKYETIDAAQIDIIMEGKVPPPPSGWDDSEPKSGGGSAVKEGDEQVSKEDDASGSIGGPANQH